MRARRTRQADVRRFQFYISTITIQLFDFIRYVATISILHKYDYNFLSCLDIFDHAISILHKCDYNRSTP